MTNKSNYRVAAGLLLSLSLLASGCQGPDATAPKASERELQISTVATPTTLVSEQASVTQPTTAMTSSAPDEAAQLSTVHLPEGLKFPQTLAEILEPIRGTDDEAWARRIYRLNFLQQLFSSDAMDGDLPGIPPRLEASVRGRRELQGVSEKDLRRRMAELYAELPSPLADKTTRLLPEGDLYTDQTRLLLLPEFKPSYLYRTDLFKVGSEGERAERFRLALIRADDAVYAYRPQTAAVALFEKTENGDYRLLSLREKMTGKKEAALAFPQQDPLPSGRTLKDIQRQRDAAAAKTPYKKDELDSELAQLELRYTAKGRALLAGPPGQQGEGQRIPGQNWTSDAYIKLGAASLEGLDRDLHEIFTDRCLAQYAYTNDDPPLFLERDGQLYRWGLSFDLPDWSSRDYEVLEAEADAYIRLSVKLLETDGRLEIRLLHSTEGLRIDSLGASDN